MIKYLPAHLLKKERYKLFVYLLAYFFMVFEVEAYGQTTSLNACFDLARKNNLSVKQARSALLSGQYNLQAEKKSYLPKVDLLSSYTYLSSPLTINLQTAKDGIVNGSSQQSVNAANEVFKEITGNNLSQAVQDRIYNTSKNIIY